MAVDFLLIFGGFALLLAGGEWFVRAASEIARMIGASELVIGLTVVAFGTSSPELIVSLLAAGKGSADVCIGNIIGSNIGNILLILGVSAAINPLFAARGTVWKEIPFMLLASVVLAVQVNDILLDQAATSALSRADALVLLCFFAIFLYYVAHLLKSSQASQPAGTARAPFSFRPFILAAVGLGMLILGGNWIVNGAVSLARIGGLSETAIGLTIVAIGTSLPELVTSAMAAWRGKSDIAVGNIVGSNIFNILLILGITGTVTPLPFSAEAGSDVLVMLGATVLLFVVMVTGKPLRQVQRAEGVLFISLYVGYLGWVLSRSA